MSMLTTPIHGRVLNPLKTPMPIITPVSSTAPFSVRQNIKHLVCKAVTRCSLNDRDSYEPVVAYPRPSEIQWKKELSNSVQLIGMVGSPVQLTRFSSGKVVASTRLAVRTSATDTTWVNLRLWDQLAHIAHQHVEKGQQIYVSGRLISDTVEGDDGKQQIYYKVVVQQLNFVERNSPSPVALYDGTSDSTPVGKKDDSVVHNRLSTQELWQAFFANPLDWWDNRNNKRNLKSPDFRHKDTGEALWVDSKYNPPWVKSQLEILDSKMQSYQSQDAGGLFNYLSDGY